MNPATIGLIIDAALRLAMAGAAGIERLRATKERLDRGEVVTLEELVALGDEIRAPLG